MASAFGQRHAQLMEAAIRRLQSFGSLAPEIMAVLRSLDHTQSYPAMAQLNDGGAPPKPVFLLAGWAARVRWLADGRRQIIGFILPGEAIGLCVRPHPLALAPTLALTPLITMDASPVMRALQNPCGLTEVLSASAAMDEALLLDQVVRLGRQTAYERICHLLLELRDRLSDVGLDHGGAFRLPLTQEVIADATGLSVVHVNRILQRLRKEGLLDLRSGRAMILDPQRMSLAADYHRPVPSAWA